MWLRCQPTQRPQPCLLVGGGGRQWPGPGGCWEPGPSFNGGDSSAFSLLLLRGTVWSSRYFHKSWRREGRPPCSPALGLPPRLPPAASPRYSYPGFGAKSLLAAVPRIPRGPLPHSFILSFIPSPPREGVHFAAISPAGTQAGRGPDFGLIY